jgi:transposase
MGKPLSMDIRSRALAAVDAGSSRRAAAGRFGVSVSSVIRRDASRRATGSFEPQPQGGDTRSKDLEERHAEIMVALEEEGDQTLEELRGRLTAQGIATSTSALSRFFRRHGITRKKKTGHAVEQDRPDVLRKRRAWFETQPDLDPERLVFIDEPWAATNMARSHGRCRRGDRLRMGFPHGHRKTTTLVAGLRLDGMIAPMVLDGPINGDWFEAYVAHVLAPALRPGDIVVMDNSPATSGRRPGR